MKQATRIFGVPFDPPNSPERLNLKLAYLSHLARTPYRERFRDPYDAFEADLSDKYQFYAEGTWLGKMPVASWLTPRPLSSDLPMLTPHRFMSFLEENGCWDYALKVAKFVEEQVFPYRPIMIGVDHSLTGGLLLALTKRCRNLNVIILDAHFDVMGFNGEKLPFYQCGNFLSYLLEKEVIQPQNLWVLGVGEEILPENNQYKSSLSSRNTTEFEKWIDRGVHVLSRKDVVSEAISIELNGPTYVSVDMDIGSLSSIFSARFMNCYGLPVKEFLHLLSVVATSIRKADVPLLGLDIMEIDIHFLEAAEAASVHDYTRHIVKEILNLFLVEVAGLMQGYN